MWYCGKALPLNALLRESERTRGVLRESARYGALRALTTPLSGCRYSFAWTFCMNAPSMKNSSMPAAMARTAALAGVEPFHLVSAHVTPMITSIRMNPGITLLAVMFITVSFSGLKYGAVTGSFSRFCALIMNTPMTANPTRMQAWTARCVPGRPDLNASVKLLTENDLPWSSRLMTPRHAKA